ncbi:MAG: GAF domain-containing protein, partial [Anaerolineae bacterium]|nr:GAF domain-containing protein [Anaerolineae bacterium]
MTRFCHRRPAEVEAQGLNGRWYQTRIIPVFDEGRVVAATSLTLDIHAQKDLERSLQRQRDYLETLNNMTLDLLERLNIREVLHALVEKALHILQADQGAIFLLADDGEAMEQVEATPHLEPRQGQRLRRGEAVAGRVWVQGQMLTVEDYATWEGRHPDPIYDSMHYTVGVPIKIDDAVVGVLVMGIQAVGRQFDAEEITQLQDFARLTAVAIDNARLYAQVQDERAALERRVAARTAELHTLSEISQALSRAPDETAMMMALAQPAIEDGVDSVALYYIDVDAYGTPEWFTLTAIWRRAPDDAAMPIGARFYIPQFPAFDLLLQNPDQPLFLEDIARDPRLDDITRSLFLLFTTNALLGVALTQGGAWVGAIVFSWFYKPHYFSEREHAIYHALPALAAPAFANYRRHREQQRAQVDTLYALSQAISAAPSEEALLHRLAEPLHRFAVESMSFYTVEGDSQEAPQAIRLLSVWRAPGIKPRVSPGQRFDLAQFPSTHALTQPPYEPLLIEDLGNDRRLDANVHAVLKDLGLQRLAFVPLARRERQVWSGLLVLGWRQPAPFSEAEQTVYTAMPAMVSPVLENILLVR